MRRVEKEIRMCAKAELEPESRITRKGDRRRKSG